MKAIETDLVAYPREPDESGVLGTTPIWSAKCPVSGALRATVSP